MDKYLTSSQPDPINEEINRLRYKAFRSNSEDDKRDLMLYLLRSWSVGDLVSRDLVDKEIYK